MESNVRKLRLKKNITQMELADAVGISQQMISRMEKDRNTIKVKNLIVMADYFHVSTDTILGYCPVSSNVDISTELLKKDIKRIIKVVKKGQYSKKEEAAIYEMIANVKRYLDEYGI